jgi:hypothetical protein
MKPVSPDTYVSYIRFISNILINQARRVPTTVGGLPPDLIPNNLGRH